MRRPDWLQRTIFLFKIAQGLRARAITWLSDSASNPSEGCIVIHFMDQDPVIPKGGLIHPAAHMNADGRLRESISGTAADAGAVIRPQ